jgi:hypothetical protein
MLGLADPGAAPFAHAALLLCCSDPPKLVFRPERPTTDFLGTGAGPMAFDRRREMVVPSLQSMGMGSPWLRAKRVETRRFLIPLFRAVRTKQSQPGIIGVTVRTLSMPGENQSSS